MVMNRICRKSSSMSDWLFFQEALKICFKILSKHSNFEKLLAQIPEDASIAHINMFLSLLEKLTIHFSILSASLKNVRQSTQPPSLLWARPLVALRTPVPGCWFLSRGACIWPCSPCPAEWMSKRQLPLTINAHAGVWTDVFHLLFWSQLSDLILCGLF